MDAKTNQTKEHTLLKFITCGSVDDGKSTLIGHILYDSKLLYADQIKALELESKLGSCGGKIDYSLLLDGLQAEREQGITIDVAYRYFTTKRRSFIVADTPGHEEYTRNMAVGASFADLAIILVDASQGVLIQTRRHARICALMGIKYFVFAVNKMDLIEYSEEKFRKIEQDISKLKEELSLTSVQVIPVSATVGDNITKKSENIVWYNGEALLPYLEELEVSDGNPEKGFYMPVQRVCRPDRTFRGFQGQVESGSVSVGDEVVILPSGETVRVKSLYSGFNQVESVDKGRPATIQLDREVDVSRGCVIAKDTETVSVTTSVTANILWMDDKPLSNGRDCFVKLGTRLIPGSVDKIHYSVNVNTGEKNPTDTLNKNELASCDISFNDPVVTDLFAGHRVLGELIIIDRVTNMTSACGVVVKVNSNKGAEDSSILRLKQKQQQSGVFTLSSEVYSNEQANAIERKLLLKGRHAYLYHLSGNSDLDSIVINKLVEAGLVVLVYGNVNSYKDNVSGVYDTAISLDDIVEEIFKKTYLTR